MAKASLTIMNSTASSSSVSPTCLLSDQWASRMLSLMSVSWKRDPLALILDNSENAMA